MTSPDDTPTGQSDPGIGQVSDEQERRAARQEQDTDGSEPDPREPRDGAEPFSGSEH